MRQLLRIALIGALVLPGLPRTARPATATTGDGLVQAQALVAKGEYQQAATLLEELLPEARDADRVAAIGLLRQSYRKLIDRAEAAGRKAEAASYRDDLEILNAAGPREPAAAMPPPRPEPKPAPATAPSPAPVQTPPPADPAPAVPAHPAPADAPSRPLPRTQSPADPAPLVEPATLPDPGPPPELSGPQPARAIPVASEPGLPAPVAEGSQTPASRKPRVAAPAPAAVEGPAEPATTSATELSRADLLFNAKKYEEAGRIYARMAATNQLPSERKQVWAYCRWVAVVARINAPPRDGREWDAIEQEVRSIQRLTPGNWYGEYLRNRVAEARRGIRGAGRNGRVVVRGSEPDEPAPRPRPRLFGRSRAATPASPPPANPAAPAEPLRLPAPAAEEPPSATPGPATTDDPPSDSPAPIAPAEAPAPGQPALEPASPAPLAWQVRETANFKIYHTDPVLAEKAAAAAESVRSKQARRWGSSATRSTWKPACEIYLYPTASAFSEMTGQPETSPGFSTMGLNANRITARRVNLRADHPQLLTAILPHEVTHVVLADLFTQQQIPRWADEGMAVLAEPLTEQLNRASDLTGPLADGKVFKLNELMAIDYPNADAWNLYYAQSVSLTQFLVEQSSPEQFIRFVRGAQRDGIEAALRDVYRINGFADLEKRWQTYARRQVAEIASAREAASGSEAARRQ